MYFMVAWSSFRFDADVLSTVSTARLCELNCIPANGNFYTGYYNVVDGGSGELDHLTMGFADFVGQHEVFGFYGPSGTSGLKLVALGIYLTLDRYRLILQRLNL